MARGTAYRRALRRRHEHGRQFYPDDHLLYRTRRVPARAEARGDGAHPHADELCMRPRHWVSRHGGGAVSAAIPTIYHRIHRRRTRSRFSGAHSARPLLATLQQGRRARRHGGGLPGVSGPLCGRISYLRRRHAPYARSVWIRSYEASPPPSCLGPPARWAPRRPRSAWCVSSFIAPAPDAAALRGGCRRRRPASCNWSEGDPPPRRRYGPLRRAHAAPAPRCASRWR